MTKLRKNIHTGKEFGKILGCHKENLQAAVVSDSHISGGVQHMLNIPIEIVVINEITKNIFCASYFAKF